MQLSHLVTSDGRIFARWAKSPSDTRLVAWQDGDGKGRGGARDSGHGRYWMFLNEVEILKGQLESPNAGVVADDGTFCFEDWLFTHELKSIFYVFAPDGGVVVRKQLAANLSRSALSPSGAYAICHTAASSDSKHSNKLFLFNTRTGAEVWNERPPFAPARFAFSSDDTLLTIWPGPGQSHHVFQSATLAIPARSDA